jgi:O-antigen ligase
MSFTLNVKGIASKRRLITSFFVIALLCLLRASRSTEPFFWWLGLCLLVTMISSQQKRPFVLSWISTSLVGFCLLLFINVLYLSPTYHASSLYRPATLLIAFAAATCRPTWFTQTGFKIFCGSIALIAAWAVLQWLTGWGFLVEKSARALALFTTPNILAMTLNLGLAPVLAYYLLGRGGRGVYGLTLLLFAALLTTQSRGGYLGLLAGISLLVVFVGQDAVIAQRQRYRAVAVGFLAVLGFFKFYAWLGLASWSLDSVFATLRHGDSSYRWEIYQIAWQGLAEHLWLGSGYFNFGYYFEAHKVPPFLDKHLTFVHNDYLQLAFETGLLGLFLFLLLIVSVYGQLFKFRQQVIAEQRLPLILSAVAMTPILFHALVDYPFYIPISLAVFGAYLAIANQQFIEMDAAHWQLPTISTRTLLGFRSGFICNLLLIVLMTLLGVPAIAAVSASYGLERLQHGDAERGLYWHSIARTLQPRDANYYWREGVIWRDLGIAQMRPDLLEKSDVIFTKGGKVNPFEVNNLLEKIALHRQHGIQLKHRASNQDIMAWINYARNQQPHSYGVQMEYVQCLDFIGERAQAIEQAKMLVHRWPQSKSAQSLLESVSHD